MRHSFSVSSLVLVAGAALVAGCASYDGRGLQPGVSSVDEVVSVMGKPAMQWKDPDGRMQLAYPRGPEGLQTFMAFVDAQGRLERIEGVLEKSLARSDDPLAYYVAQAREVIDLSLLAQKQMVDDLRQVQGATDPLQAA